MKGLLQTIQSLSEEQAKEALLHLMQMGFEKDVVHSALEEALQGVHKKPRNPHSATSVHLVSGQMATISLRYAFPEELVIGIEDNLSIGPLESLTESSGRIVRKTWLSERLVEENHYWTYEEKWQEIVDTIRQIPAHLPVYVWAAEHAGEQLGMRLLLTLLEQHSNDIYIIPSTQVYREFFDSENRHTLDIHTAEMSREQLQQIANRPGYMPLTPEEKRHLIEKWRAQSNTSCMVRVYEDGNIQEFDEDMLDDMILRVVEEQSMNGEFVKAPRIVGEVYGRYANQLGDAFVEYRLLQLLTSGKLEMQGTPKEMRLYSVRKK
ncbi:DUF3658 domain-containing protein [Chryseomicrobium palamuruense]|uniref:DUF3658 domain-containing protein n=1 Tax=Chryseomicrobium palamuruense TaxID=682973 RepID=A0ABV8UVN9_9BACL